MTTGTPLALETPGNTGKLLYEFEAIHDGHVDVVVCICVPVCCIGAKRKEFSGELVAGRQT
jgi:hypothetical protein